ncbi:hypothetical protein SHKM778_60470 [Streptomyces sp. KM77-8]|uniref:Uncharacterized protein n=1 Tax=Streptomyces haneummycinicus TaxID=3074435 RepID=A0AAT9HQL7_9ACTN
MRGQTAGTGVCRVPSLTHTTDNAPALSGVIAQRGPVDEAVTEITDRRRPSDLTTPGVIGVFLSLGQDPASDEDHTQSERGTDTDHGLLQQTVHVALVLGVL